MGITLEIRNKQQVQWAPQAWLTAMPPLSNGSRGRMRLSDTLSRMHKKAQNPYGGPRVLGQYTSRDLAQMFFKPVEDYFINGRGDTNVLVMVLDDDKHTPAEKLEEQNRRTKDRAMYPSDVEFVDEGVKISVPVTSNETVRQVDLIDFAKVMANRTVRKKMWQYCIKYMQTQVLPNGCTLIVSCDRSGPWMWQGNKPAQHMTQWAHNLGEFDTSVPYWLWMFREYDIVVECEDTDFIPISMSYLSAAPQDCIPKSLVWHYVQKKDEKYFTRLVDMKVLMNDTLESTGMTAQQFILAVILAGTDFYDKQWISGYFNEGLIFEAIASGKEYLYRDFMECCLSSAQESKEAREKRVQTGLEKLELFVRTLFTLQLAGHKDTPANRKVLIDEQKRSPTKRKREEQHALEEEISKRMKFSTNRFDPATTTNNPYKTKHTTRETDETKIWDSKYIQTRLEHRKTVSASKKTATATTTSRGFRYPTQENLQKAFQRLEFNLEYWLRSWQKYTFFHPNPDSTKVPGLNA